MPITRAMNSNQNVLGIPKRLDRNILGYLSSEEALQSIPAFQFMTSQEQAIITNSSLFPSQFNELRTIIFDYIAIPLLRNEDTFLRDNMYMITIIKNRLKNMMETYPDEDFSYYKHIVDLITMTFEKAELLHKYDNITTSKGDVATVRTQIKRVYLRTEYEIYNIIYGRPNISNGEVYKQDRIHKINLLLEEDGLIRIEDFRERL